MATNNNNRKGNNNRRDDRDDFRKEKDEKPTKRTFCKAGIGHESGKRWVSGVNYYKNWSFIAGPYEGTSVHTSEQGIDWENWVAEFKINGFPQPGVMPCLYNPRTGAVHFDKLQMIAKPSSPNGGYFGKWTKD